MGFAGAAVVERTKPVPDRARPPSPEPKERPEKPRDLEKARTHADAADALTEDQLYYVRLAEELDL